MLPFPHARIYIVSLEYYGYCMYHQVQHSEILRPVRAMYLFVLYRSVDKQRLFSRTALNDGFFNRKEACSLRGAK
jgi:hypothetical protein